MNTRIVCINAVPNIRSDSQLELLERVFNYGGSGNAREQVKMLNIGSAFGFPSSKFNVRLTQCASVNLFMALLGEFNSKIHPENSFGD